MRRTDKYGYTFFYESKKYLKGEIYLYDFGTREGSVQGGFRPVIILQDDLSMKNSPTCLIAPVTSSLKKTDMNSHVILPDSCGLPEKSMVLLEQIKTVNKEDLGKRVGKLEDEETWSALNRGLTRQFGLRIKRRERIANIKCLCKECMIRFIKDPRFIIRRLDGLDKTKSSCEECGRDGSYDYVIFDKSRQFGKEKK